ncbi:MAG TPA: PilZ domain-containing protein [Gammaproteobacteria bacterium]|nr:PilZ domain-containing protein [Gammaproteobacteria bacterium]
MERRYSSRKPATVHVYVAFPGSGAKKYKTMNLSAHGILVKTGKRQARPGAIASLIFVIRHGNVVRLHRRKATVAHVTNTSTGMMLHHQAQSKIA